MNETASSFDFSVWLSSVGSIRNRAYETLREGVSALSHDIDSNRDKDDLAGAVRTLSPRPERTYQRFNHRPKGCHKSGSILAMGWQGRPLGLH